MGADQVAAIRPMIAELEEAARYEPGVPYCAQFEVPGREAAWVQVLLGTVNMAYPFADDPTARLQRAGLRGLPGFELAECLPGVSATLAYAPLTPNREVAKLVDDLFSVVLEQGDDYPVHVGIIRLVSEEPGDAETWLGDKRLRAGTEG